MMGIRNQKAICLWVTLAYTLNVGIGEATMDDGSPTCEAICAEASAGEKASGTSVGLYAASTEVRELQAWGGGGGGGGVEAGRKLFSPEIEQWVSDIQELFDGDKEREVPEIVSDVTFLAGILPVVHVIFLLLTLGSSSYAWTSILTFATTKCHTPCRRQSCREMTIVVRLYITGAMIPTLLYNAFWSYVSFYARFYTSESPSARKIRRKDFVEVGYYAYAWLLSGAFFLMGLVTIVLTWAAPDFVALAYTLVGAAAAQVLALQIYSSIRGVQWMLQKSNILKAIWIALDYLTTYIPELRKIRKWLKLAGGSLIKAARWCFRTADNIEQGFVGIKAWFDGAGVDVIDWFDGAGVDIKDWFYMAGVDTKDWFDDAGRDIKHAFEHDVKDAFDDAGREIKHAFEHDVKDAFDEAGREIKHAFENDVRDWFVGAGETLFR